MIIHHKTFRTELIDKIIKFVNQIDEYSSRTVDVVKSINVLMVQFICLLEIRQQIKIDEFGNEKDIQSIKEKFFRFAMEEILRRHINPLEEFVQNEKQLLNYLFKENKSFIEECFYQRS